MYCEVPKTGENRNTTTTKNDRVDDKLPKYGSGSRLKRTEASETVDIYYFDHGNSA